MARACHAGDGAAPSSSSSVKPRQVQKEPLRRKHKRVPWTVQDERPHMSAACPGESVGLLRCGLRAKREGYEGSSTTRPTSRTTLQFAQRKLAGGGGLAFHKGTHPIRRHGSVIGSHRH